MNYVSEQGVRQSSHYCYKALVICLTRTKHDSLLTAMVQENTCVFTHNVARNKVACM